MKTFNLNKCYSFFFLWTTWAIYTYIWWNVHFLDVCLFWARMLSRGREREINKPSMMKPLHHNHSNKLAEYNIWLFVRPQSNNNNNKIPLEHTSQFSAIWLGQSASFNKLYVYLFSSSSLKKVTSHCSLSITISFALVF